ncbi:MAG: hypothetical protein LUI10_01375 [Lachnospiraceae bacterium]|nr:hypothetical protein [Lachnospiraceae bacterium]
MAKDTRKHPEEKIAGLLTDYEELQDLLEDTLQEFDQIHMEVEDAMDEIQETLERARTLLSRCHLGLKRIPPVSLITCTEEEAPVLPFN